MSFCTHITISKMYRYAHSLGRLINFKSHFSKFQTGSGVQIRSDCGPVQTGMTDPYQQKTLRICRNNVIRTQTLQSAFITTGGFSPTHRGLGYPAKN
jgi:hypothetical protein